MRATTGAAYTDGSAPIVPETERLVDGAEITDNRTVKADVCVIGTGAGGAPVAKELAEGGAEVVMLEEGRHFTADDYTARPREMTTLLFRDAGQTTTLGNVPIVLPLGKAVGGSTLINSGTCFRTPAAVLEMWGKVLGLEALSADELDPYFRRVERIQNVAQVPAELGGGNALVVKRGADRLGWSGDFIHRNVRGCVGSAVCQWGCPTSAKQHVGMTYVPLAWNAGAATYANARARRVLVDRWVARGVEATTKAGGTLRVECDTVIVACGTIQTPLLLRRQGIESPELGRNLSLHPATGVQAVLDEDVDMARGVPQSYFIDEFCDEGIMFEGAAGPPDYMAMALHFSGERLRELMLRYRNLSQFGVMVSDRPRGFVRERGGRIVIRYDLGRAETAVFKRGIELLCELYFEAGARTVLPPVDGLGELKNGDLEPLKRRELRPQDLTLMAFHPLGTARAHADRQQGVVDENLKVNGIGSLYVADGSVVPSSLGVNPQLTIMTLATRLAYHLLAKPAPDDEPHPESIAEPRLTRSIHGSEIGALV